MKETERRNKDLIVYVKVLNATVLLIGCFTTALFCQESRVHVM